jgi:hypothetical protein
MHKFLAQGMFGSNGFDTIEEARAVLNFAFEQYQKSEEQSYQIQCRIMFEQGYMPICVPFDTQQIPPADEYACFDMYSGEYVVYKTFEDAKKVVEEQRQKRSAELKASYSISTCSTDPETGEESWVVIETLGGTNE